MRVQTLIHPPVSYRRLISRVETTSPFPTTDTRASSLRQTISPRHTLPLSLESAKTMALTRTTQARPWTLDVGWMISDFYPSFWLHVPYGRSPLHIHYEAAKIAKFDLIGMGDLRNGLLACPRNTSSKITAAKRRLRRKYNKTSTLLTTRLAIHAEYPKLLDPSGKMDFSMVTLSKNKWLFSTLRLHRSHVRRSHSRRRQRSFVMAQAKTVKPTA